MKSKAKELREKTVDELHGKERELAGQLFALRLNKATGGFFMGAGGLLLATNR